MKKLFILAVMLLSFGFANAQKVYSINNESYANVKVYVVSNEAYADLLVYKVTNEAPAPLHL